MITAQKVYAKAIFPDSPQAYGTVLALITAGLNCGTFLGVTLGFPISSYFGTYRAAVWVGTIMAFLGVGCNLYLLFLERNYEYDAVQRRQLLEDPQAPSYEHQREPVRAGHVALAVRRQSITDSIVGQFHPHDPLADDDSFMDIPLEDDGNDVEPEEKAVVPVPKSPGIELSKVRVRAESTDSVGDGYVSTGDAGDGTTSHLQSTVKRGAGSGYGSGGASTANFKRRGGRRKTVLQRFKTECRSVWRTVKGFSLAYWMLALLITSFFSAFTVVIVFARDVFEVSLLPLLSCPSAMDSLRSMP